MAVTNDDLLEAVRAVQESIPGKGVGRLATEEYIGKQIAELKKSAGGKEKAATPEEKKSEPGAIGMLVQGIFGKELVEAVKGVAPSVISFKGLVTLGLALMGTFAIKLFSFDTALKDLLALKNRSLEVGRFGAPVIRNNTPTPTVEGPDTQWVNLAVNRIETATKKLDTAIGGLHTKVDGLLAEFA
ncbi:MULTISPECIES: hypothetical protein [unclassified Streptomyces]|uniref:hypothetical protein n=1 Tax=unclassified Streptomyces TaxID=2593676 RepID=UPI002E1656A8|nr:hypothetical protein OG471_25135 [Streptomyces sp. NBC_01336]